MIVIELCGIPGCGKSTTYKYLKENKSEFMTDIKDYSAIYPKGKLARAIVKQWGKVKTQLGMLSEKEQIIYDFMKAQGCNNINLISKAVTMYSMLERADKKDNENVIVLDEGLLQYLSSAAYDTELKNPDVLRSVFLPYKNIQYRVVRFDCSIRQCIERIKGRGKGDRYDISDEAALTELVRIKGANIDCLIALSGFEHYSIFTDGSIEENGSRLEAYLK